MRYLLGGIEKNLILRKPRSGCLEGRAMLVPAAYRKLHKLSGVASLDQLVGELRQRPRHLNTQCRRSFLVNYQDRDRLLDRQVSRLCTA
jgi:hypothetical protein